MLSKIEDQTVTVLDKSGIQLEVLDGEDEVQYLDKAEKSMAKQISQSKKDSAGSGCSAGE